MLNALTAALVVVFDVNFMQAGASVNESNFLKNLIGFINQGGVPLAPANVPTLSEFGLLLMAGLLALSAIYFLRRRSR